MLVKTLYKLQSFQLYFVGFEGVSRTAVYTELQDHSYLRYTLPVWALVVFGCLHAPDGHIHQGPR